MRVHEYSAMECCHFSATHRENLRPSLGLKRRRCWRGCWHLTDRKHKEAMEALALSPKVITGHVNGSGPSKSSSRLGISLMVLGTVIYLTLISYSFITSPIRIEIDHVLIDVHGTSGWQERQDSLVLQNRGSRREQAGREGRW